MKKLTYNAGKVMIVTAIGQVSGDSAAQQKIDLFQDGHGRGGAARSWPGVSDDGQGVAGKANAHRGRRSGGRLLQRLTTWEEEGCQPHRSALGGGGRWLRIPYALSTPSGLFRITGVVRHAARQLFRLSPPPDNNSVRQNQYRSIPGIVQCNKDMEAMQSTQC